MNERGAPTPVAWTRLRAPESLMGPADPAAMTAAVDGLAAAREVRRGGRPGVRPREARGAGSRRGAAKAEAEERAEAASGGGGRAGRAGRSGRAGTRDGIGYPAPGPTGQRPEGSGDALGDLLSSPVAKDLMRTATREILRGVFKTGRR